MVCLGNICRSPLAEGIMQQKATEAGLNWQVDSAGTGDWHIGQPPHNLSQKIARHYGIDISLQKGRQFCKEDLDRYDQIFFMDENNLKDAKRMAGNKWDTSKTGLMLNECYPASNQSVPDPYLGEEKDYHEVFQLLSDACDAYIKRFLQPSTH